MHGEESLAGTIHLSQPGALSRRKPPVLSDPTRDLKEIRPGSFPTARSPASKIHFQVIKDPSSAHPGSMLSTSKIHFQVVRPWNRIEVIRRDLLKTQTFIKASRGLHVIKGIEQQG